MQFAARTSPAFYALCGAENANGRRTCFYIAQDSIRLSRSPRVFRALGAENLYSRRADFHIVQYSMRLLCTNLRHLSIARCVRVGQRRREVRKKSLNGNPRVPFRLRLFYFFFFLSLPPARLPVITATAAAIPPTRTTAPAASPPMSAQLVALSCGASPPEASPSDAAGADSASDSPVTVTRTVSSSVVPSGFCTAMAKLSSPTYVRSGR